MTCRQSVRLNSTARMLALAMVLAGAACGNDSRDNAPVTAEPCDVARVRGPDSDLCLGATALGALRLHYLSLARAGTLMTLRGGFDPRLYPAEALASVDAVARQTRSDELSSWVARELDALEARINASEGFLIWPDQIDGKPTFGANTQARLLLSLTLMNHVSPSPQLRRMMDRSHSALERLPTVPVTSTFTGRVYQLPPYAFHAPIAPRAISSRSVDPNQDAALAVAYALYAKSLPSPEGEAAARARAKARHYLSSAMDLVQPGRCTPLADQIEFRNACDTRYNGFHMALLQVAAVALGEPLAAEAVADQYQILRRYWIAGQTMRVYPGRYVGAVPDPVELMLLLPLVATHAPGDLDAIAAKARRLFEPAAGSDFEKWPVGWLFPKAFVDATLSR